jgi:hypothetical protein
MLPCTLNSLEGVWEALQLCCSLEGVTWGFKNLKGKLEYIIRFAEDHNIIIHNIIDLEGRFRTLSGQQPDYASSKKGS